MNEHEAKVNWKLDPRTEKILKEMAEFFEKFKPLSFREMLREELRRGWKKFLEIFRLW